LRVLHECHVRRVVHGDVRVANILVDSAKIDVTLIDFGFATIDSRKSLIGNRNSSAEDVRQVALVTLAVMCGITYGSQDYSHLLRFEWSRFDFGMLLQCDNRASLSLAKWQLELVYLAIEWGRNCTKLSCSTMHEQLLAISQPQSLVPQPQVKPATAMARSSEKKEKKHKDDDAKAVAIVREVPAPKLTRRETDATKIKRNDNNNNAKAASKVAMIKPLQARHPNIQLVT